MKRVVLFLAVVLSYGGVREYFDALERMPEFKIDNLKVKEAKVNKNSVVNEFYPKVSLSASATHYSLPVSLRPVIPNEKELLFYQNITKVGVNLSLPLFIKELYDNKKKMEALLKASKYKAKLSFLEREALLVGDLSNFNYMLSLKDALLKKKSSIQTTIKAIKEGVSVGRIAEFKLMRLEDELLNIDIEVKKIENSIASLKAKIYKLTKININKRVEIKAFMPKRGEFFALKPIKSEITAKKYGIEAARDKFLPRVFLKADGYRAFGEGDAANFGSVGIYINWDVFNKKNSSAIQKAKIAYLKSKLNFKKSLKDLIATQNELLANIKNLNHSISLAKKSIEVKKRLLKSAKVAFELNEMSVDEYLGYEYELAKARASLASLVAKRNLSIANLAFIYGEDLKKVFK